MDNKTKFQIPNLEDYHISQEYGFMLPDPLYEVPIDQLMNSDLNGYKTFVRLTPELFIELVDPETHLPEYFEPWNKLAHNLPHLTEYQCVREEVNRLPELDYNRLKGHKQYRCAYLFLSAITSGYVWQEGDIGVLKVLPRQVAIPLHGVATYLGMPPITLHASMVLANCRLIDKEKGPLLSNLTSTVSFHQREACDWFFTVTALVELTFTPAIKVMIDGLHGVLSGDRDAVQTSLNSLSTILDNMKDAVSHMHEKLPGNIFYNNIRPFLAGWGGNGSPLPEGLIFEGVSTKPLILTGGSAAQSSTINCVDAVLGIQHNPDKQKFLDKMRTYMPPAHAQFIEALQRGPSLRNFVLSSEDTDLHEAYNTAIHSLEQFRSYHVQIVSKYIVQQSAAHKEKKYESLAEKGTGGTSVMPFLKDLRNSTRKAKID